MWNQPKGFLLQPVTTLKSEMSQNLSFSYIEFNCKMKIFFKRPIYQFIRSVYFKSVMKQFLSICVNHSWYLNTRHGIHPNKGMKDDIIAAVFSCRVTGMGRSLWLRFWNIRSMQDQPQIIHTGGKCFITELGKAAFLYVLTKNYLKGLTVCIDLIVCICTTIIWGQSPSY